MQSPIGTIYKFGVRVCVCVVCVCVRDRDIFVSRITQKPKCARVTELEGYPRQELVPLVLGGQKAKGYRSEVKLSNLFLNA